MDWNTFEVEKTQLPEDVLKKHFEGFSGATNNLVDINILEIASMAKIGSSVGGDFQFRVVLTCEHLPNYSFTVFKFGYDVTLYPVKVDPDKDIFKELFPKESNIDGKIMISHNEASFNEAIVKILGSSKFKSVVVGIMRLAEKKINA